MRPKLDSTKVMQKIEELCTTILEQPEYKEVKKMVDDFLNDEEAINHYNRVFEKQHVLNQRKHHGMPVTKAEVDEFEDDKTALYVNPISRDFLYAQKEFGKLRDMVNKYVTKTIELERLPDESDMEEGGCGCGGGGCGCGGH